MRASLGLVGVTALAVAFSFGACECPGPNPDQDGGQDGGQDSGQNPGQDGGQDSGQNPGQDGGQDAGTCIGLGNTCSSSGGLPCCTGGTCNGSTCQPVCGNFGASCSSPSQCCSGTCGTNNTCVCKQVGVACQSAGDCCTGLCNGTCQALPGASCKVTGQQCGGNTECCSSFCNNGFCAAIFGCQAYNDVCTFDGQCCSFDCNIPTGATAGRCNQPSGGCVGAGNPCARSSDCCSRVCADFGGGSACQPTIGCRPQGDNCTPAGDPQACCGSAVCQTDHTCNNGTACRGAGMICGKPMTLLPDGGLGPCAKLPGTNTCYTTNQETNCCDSLKVGGNEYFCRVDVGGVPRCVGGLSGACPTGYTGDPPCCIAEGNYCDFKDQCCNGLPCTVGADGGRQCVGSSCLAIGNTCDPANNRCCSGTSCLPTSEIGFACQVPMDGGSCSGDDAGCTTGATCCTGFCTNNKCGPRPPCQPQGSTCTTSADCCSLPPLTCVLNPGSTSGTCQPPPDGGTSCLQPGQTCTSTTGCCNGLFCADQAANLCTTTFNGCSCQVIIGSKDPGTP